MDMCVDHHDPLPSQVEMKFKCNNIKIDELSELILLIRINGRQDLYHEAKNLQLVNMTPTPPPPP